MNIIILPTPEGIGRFAAEQVAAVVSEKPNAVIGVATGSIQRTRFAAHVTNPGYNAHGRIASSQCPVLR